MKVKILSYTENPEQVVATAAKLCYSGSDIESLFEKQTPDTIERFINKLSEMGHESPFEHVSFTFAIEGVSRITEQQLTRHRLASYSIQSGRYVNRNNAQFYIPAEIENNEEMKVIYLEQIESSKQAYEQLSNGLLCSYIEKYIKEHIIDKGLSYFFNRDEQDLKNFKETFPKEYSAFEKKAVENARAVFPNSLETKIIVTMNVRSLWNFFRHRCCNRAQEEIRELARIMLRLVREIAPMLFKYAGPHCVTGICSEGNMQCEQLKGKIPTNDIIKELIRLYYNKQGS